MKTFFPDLKDNLTSFFKLDNNGFSAVRSFLRRLGRVLDLLWDWIDKGLSTFLRLLRWFGQRIYRTAHWWFLIFVSAIRRFDRHDCVMRSAAISYFGLISFFPLVLVVITVASYFLESTAAQRQVLELVEANAPAAIDLVQGNMEQILRYRRTIGVLAVVLFFWSASAVFSTIDRALNRIWDVETLRPYWRSKLIAILVTIAIGLLSMLSIFTTAIANFFRQIILPFLTSQWGISVGPWRVLVLLIPYVSSIMLYLIVYWIFPHMRMSLLDIWPGALLAGLVWEQAKVVFTDYMASFGSSNLVYGSVGTIIAVMVWFYLSALILLMGAEISAAYSRARRRLKT